VTHERAEKDRIDGQLRAGLTSEGSGVEGNELGDPPGNSPHQVSDLWYRALPLATVKGTMGLVLEITRLRSEHLRKALTVSSGSNPMRMSASPSRWWDFGGP